MKRLHPSDNEEAMPKKFLRKSLGEEVEYQKTDEESIEGMKVLKGFTENVGGELGNSVATSCQNNQSQGYEENNVNGSRTPLRSSVKAYNMETRISDAPTTDNPRRSRRVSGSQAIILRSRRFSGDADGLDKCTTVNVSQRPRRNSVGESKMLRSSLDTTPSRGSARPRKSLGDPIRATEGLVKLVPGPKTSRRPVGRPPKVTRNIHDDELNTLESRQKRSHTYSGKEEEVEDMRNNNALKVKESQFSCGVCCKSFEFAKGLNMHMIKMHKIADHEKRAGVGRVDQCAICGKEFTEASLLVEHKKDPKAHKRPYACSFPHCSRTFVQLEHLLNHKSKVHEDLRVDQCQNCHMQFSSPGALAFHRNLKYCKPPKKQQSYLTSQTPSTCTAKFSNRDLLQLHLRLRHQEDPPDLDSFVTLQETPEEINFKCNIPGCLEKFSDSHQLQKHEDCCRKQKQVTCRNCRKVFETPLDMLLHRISCEQKPDIGTNS